jgi:hypothetical protein
MELILSKFPNLEVLEIELGGFYGTLDANELEFIRANRPSIMIKRNIIIHSTRAANEISTLLKANDMLVQYGATGLPSLGESVQSLVIDRLGALKADEIPIEDVDGIFLQILITVDAVKEILQKFTKLKELTSRYPLTFDQLQSVSSSLKSLRCEYGCSFASDQDDLHSLSFPNLKSASFNTDTVKIADLNQFIQILENSITTGKNGFLENLHVVSWARIDPSSREFGQFKTSLLKVIEV